MSSVFSKSQSKPQPPKTISSLPPDLIVRVFSYLPVIDLPNVACASRRFKILVYSDGVYEPKLRFLGILECGNDSGDKAMNKLSKKIKQLPGGHMLPGSLKYLETGSLWNKEAVDSPYSSSPRTISSALPGTKITIGAGGLKALRAKNRKTIEFGGMKKSESSIASLHTLLGKPSSASTGRIGREIFQQTYSTIYPYYVDFRESQKDARVFKDFKEIAEVATILRRLRLFSQAKFLVNNEDTNLALETTIEWFESTILGNFERAYDSNQTSEMRRNAIASFQLNGGSACVQLFISKNPIFFDSTFNPSLVTSKLPSLSGPSVGYDLGDDFAKFMDHTLVNLNKQAEIIVLVFPPETDAMTVLISKVFEDSITEYVQAVILASKEREGLTIYLHTLAVCVHCCSQLVSFLETNTTGVKINTQALKETVANLFRPYAAKYIESELHHAKKKFADEIDRWNHMKRESKKLRAGTNGATFFDQNKAQAHKRQVLKTFKNILFAPVALTQAVGSAVGSAIVQASNLNRVQPHRALSKKHGSLIDTDTDDEDEDEDEEDEEEQPRLVTASPSSIKQKSSLMGGAAEIQHYNYDQEQLKQLDNGSLGSLVNLELAMSLIHTDKESLGRALVITGNTDWEKMQ
ncbi:F-box protein: endocytic membrane traffic, recycling ReCYcling 1, partial [Nowakowskiella sp. JEL0078]